MSSRAPAKVCSVCGTSYRGSYGVHASTAKHRANAHRRSDAGKSITKQGGGSRAARLRRGAAQAHRSQALYEHSSTVPVKRHRRSLPDDGAAKVVPVIRYRRHRPAVFAELRTHAGRLFRVTYSSATGKLLSTRYASGADRARFRAAGKSLEDARARVLVRKGGRVGI